MATWRNFESLAPEFFDLMTLKPGLDLVSRIKFFTYSLEYLRIMHHGCGFSIHLQETYRRQICCPPVAAGKGMSLYQSDQEGHGLLVYITRLLSN